jgi:3-hydroxybutyryl-CoA dehydrogenase
MTTGQEEKIAIIGAGAMGRGIAQIAVTGGYPVKIWDANGDVAKEALSFVTSMINRSVEKGRMDEADAKAALARLSVAGSMEDLSDSTLVVEAIIENLDIKRKVFGDLEKLVSDDCILASNTSSLSVTAIAAACDKPGRVAGYHFFNPVPLMKVVEVVKAVRTTDDVVDRLFAIAKAMGHRAVLTQDTPGFLVNHAGRGLNTEGLRVLSEGIADTATIDNIIREAAGFRMGPFELMDLTGLDVSHKVMESVYTQFYDEPKYKPSALAAQRFEAGLFGRKTGEGFYRYVDGQQIRPEDAPHPDARPRAVWLEAVTDEVRVLVTDLAVHAGVEIDQNAKPGPDSLCLVSPIGADVTTTVAELDLPAERTVGIDPLFGLDKRRTLMLSPATSADTRAAAHGLLAADEVPVSVIHDSPGFVAQRVVAMIVNIACDIAQQRIATPEDIEAAVKLGLGYPKGPLEYGDFLGAATVLRILENMYAFYGDPRYRPSPWLKRRALLGLSLLTPEG